MEEKNPRLSCCGDHPQTAPKPSVLLGPQTQHLLVREEEMGLLRIPAEPARYRESSLPAARSIWHEESN